MKDLVKRARERAHPVEVEGEEAAEAGFTLIELMVVLLIIAILLAIAIPTFLGVTNTAGDRAAQSNLTNALTEGKALYEVNDAYADSTNTAYVAASFAAQAPEFDWVGGTPPGDCEASNNGNCVSEAVFNSTSTDSQGLSLAVWSSKTDTCWYALDLEASPGTAIAAANVIPTAGVWYLKASKPATCAALLPDAAITGFPSGGTALNNGTGTQVGTNYGNAGVVG
jgi:prepilin-type N-terminal cleavage/methylation domain-containing protein